MATARKMTAIRLGTSSHVRGAVAGKYHGSCFDPHRSFPTHSPSLIYLPTPNSLPFPSLIFLHLVPISPTFQRFIYPRIYLHYPSHMSIYLHHQPSTYRQLLPFLLMSPPYHLPTYQPTLSTTYLSHLKPIFTTYT